MTPLKKNIADYARSLGFDRVGVTRAAALDERAADLKAWLAAGRNGEMSYMARAPERRADPEAHLPDAKSVIALAMNYFPANDSGRPAQEGKISRYAWGRDYHRLIGKRLDSLTRYIEALAPGEECRTFVDAGAILERGFAQRAGLGFVGKNTMVIARGLGSWIFLANVVTTLEIPEDAPDTRSCGNCRICIDACPTGAITAPYELDARRCISYLTIEQRGAIDEELRGRMNGWIYGCDVCQEVCPHNAQPSRSFEPGFSSAAPAMTLRDILSLRDAADFTRAFGSTAMTRTQWRGLLRNSCVAAATLGRQDLLEHLRRLAEGDDPIVAEHAAWAVGQLERDAVAR